MGSAADVSLCGVRRNEYGVRPVSLFYSLQFRVGEGGGRALRKPLCDLFLQCRVDDRLPDYVFYGILAESSCGVSQLTVEGACAALPLPVERVRVDPAELPVHEILC